MDAFVVYLVAVTVGGTLTLAIYRSTSWLHERGPAGRWLARCLAAVAGCVAFISTFLATGHGAVLSRSGEAPTWGEGVVLAVIMGVGYATLWPVAEWFRKGRGWG